MLIVFERDMREIVKAWLIQKGYMPAVEFWLIGSGRADIVAGKYSARVGNRIPILEEVIAVELKMDDVGGVFRQAENNHKRCDWSYVAMPLERVQRMRAKTIDKFRDSGIGILAISDIVDVYLKPGKQGNSKNMRGSKTAQQLWRRVRKLHKEHANR